MLGDDIAHDLMNQIMSNKLQENTKLKSERLLAEEYGVSRTVIREALKTLSNQGFMTILPGKGAYVRHPGSETITENLVKLRNMSDYSMYELIEVREMLESTILQRAVERASEEQLDELERLHLAITMPIDVDAFIQLDNQFHYCLFSLGNNCVMQMLATSLYDSMDTSWFIPMLMDEHKIANSVQEHAEIVAALRARDLARVKAAAMGHLHHLNRALDDLTGRS